MPFVLQSIEKELLERLSKGVYGDIYNYPEQKYQEILDREALQVASEEEDEEVFLKSFVIFSLNIPCFTSFSFLSWLLPTLHFVFFGVWGEGAVTPAGSLGLPSSGKTLADTVRWVNLFILLLMTEISRNLK